MKKSALPFGVFCADITEKELWSSLPEIEKREVGEYVIRGQKCKTLDGFFDEVSAALQFPWYFGCNWAAFDECLNDPGVMPTSGVNLYFTNARYIFSDERCRVELLGILVSNLTRACSDWSEGENGVVQVFRVIFCECDDELSRLALLHKSE